MAIDTLTLGPEPPGSTHRTSWLLVIVTVLSGLALLLMIGSQHRREPGALGSPAPLNVLVLGDASAVGEEGCPGCSSYVDQIAAAWSDDGRREVHIDRRIVAGDADLASSSMLTLVENLRSDADLRNAVSVADVILLALGSGEVTEPAAALCRATPRQPCPETPIEQVRQRLTDWLAETDAIRSHRPVVLRVITPPPASGLPRQNHVARTVCEVAATGGAVCVNVYAMVRTDEHIVAVGPGPQRPHLTQHGHNLVAMQLLALGIT